MTSVELLDAAIWREIGTEEPQPAPAFLEALAALVGRWLLVRSAASEMDAATVLCKARGYIARHGHANGEVLRHVRQPLEHADKQELKQANNATAAVAAFAGRKACWLANNNTKEK